MLGHPNRLLTIGRYGDILSTVGQQQRDLGGRVVVVVEERVDALEARTRELEARVAELEAREPRHARRRVAAPVAWVTPLEITPVEVAPVEVAPVEVAPLEATPVAATPEGASPDATAPEAATPQAASLEDLLGGRVLAWVGGLAVLVGIVFLLAIAVSRGWIGEEARTIMAGLTSLGLMGFGVRLFEHRGRTEAALAATAAGVAGLFATI